MSAIHKELRWLPPAPSDFRAQIQALATSNVPIGRQLQTLASHALDLNQLTKLASMIAQGRSKEKSLDPLSPFRLALLSNSTVDLIVPALVASAARHGVALEIIQPQYDQVAQEALRPDSKVNSARPDGVLFALDYRALPLKLSLGDQAASDDCVQGALAYLQALRAGIKSNSPAVCIFQSFPPPVEALFGNLDRALPGTTSFLVDQINRQMTQQLLSSGDVFFDVARLAEIVGLAEWQDAKLWNTAKIPFSLEFVPLYADHLGRILGSLRGKSRKALVLDLDNTLWGGVVGDDGLEGIKIAQGDPIGEAHLQVQRLAFDLRQRGIVLAVCSKNNDEVARAPFEKHPEMALRLEHIAVFQANWNDKATNLLAIANELSLGPEALVLLDDNPVERGMVRKLLPEVAVPELPDDPSYFATTLAAAGFFESVTFVSEDLKRSNFYQDNAKRVRLQKQVGGIEAYLASLDMTITFQPFDATGRTRIVQLINKSNQYNLTTRRYTEPEVAELENHPEIFTLQTRLSDIFGDNGMISVVICRPKEDGAWEIDTWLMSCRVLGRKVENMVLREILKHARRSGIQRLIGIYRQTDRNNLVRDHYEKLGFVKLEHDPLGESRWELLVETAQPDSAPMQEVSQGFVTEKQSSIA